MGAEDSIKRPLVLAYYVTVHGFGNATRIVRVARHLILAGNDVQLVIGAPDILEANYPAAAKRMRDWLLWEA